MSIMSFTEIGISDELTEGLRKQGIEMPTDIQMKVIPEIMQGTDVIAKSETGSGKTLAYLLPIFMKVDTKLRSTQAIIVTPTHELAVQVNKQAQVLAENAGVDVRSALIIGGASLTRQLDKLKEKPQIVIGSAGRILDLIKKKKIQAHTCKTIVIDEADRMLDSLNINDVKAVVKTTLASQRQIILLSASINEATKKAAAQIMGEAKIVEKEKGILPANIEHYYIVAEARDKIVVLRKIMAGLKPEHVIVFINNPNNIETMVEKLNFHGLKADGIYGTAHKNDRKNAMDSFREGRINILVASDIGARGLDFDGVEIVVNLDISEEPVYYQHRAGRTGRNGAGGMVISVVTDFEKKWLNRYEREFDIKFVEKVMSYGKLEDIKPKRSGKPNVNTTKKLGKVTKSNEKAKK
ncbi:MAG: DEAD/DEAH box helicase [Lachnospiraceae bacterium]|nr:DEAD/DEAH box helicase [Lachnospiraceae bacterium]